MKMITALHSVSFGWSRLEYDYLSRKAILNNNNNNNNNTTTTTNDYSVPEGFSVPVGFAQKNNVSSQLMIFADNSTWVQTELDKKLPLLEFVLKNSEFKKEAITSIVQQANTTNKAGVSISFDGVVIDFESMKGELLKKSFNVFLEELKKELDKSGKKLYVAVHPQRYSGQEYYNGYDYKAIGKIADKVILMAHDYNSKKLNYADMKSGYTVTPLWPIDEVYSALKAITDKYSGVEDLSKIWLQLSFDPVQ